MDPEDLLADCDIRRGRASGPGGQHRNKVETAVCITHRPSGLRGEASERRSQQQNRSAALHRLRVNLALGVRCDATDPTALWQQRCRGGRLRVNPAHADYPAILAEALDHVAATGFDPRPAAERLACSSTQLVRFIATEGRALET
ncbi:MAG: peptide chain release factor-like protein, partial [Phycisphaerae bacterium]|nr:peptide chain release factor-like protein [Phycisphaerae bacterium]